MWDLVFKRLWYYIPQPLLNLMDYIPAKGYARLRRGRAIIDKVASQLLKEKREALLAESKSSKDIFSVLGTVILAIYACGQLSFKVCSEGECVGESEDTAQRRRAHRADVDAHARGARHDGKHADMDPVRARAAPGVSEQNARGDRGVPRAAAVGRLHDGRSRRLALRHGLLEGQALRTLLRVLL